MVDLTGIAAIIGSIGGLVSGIYGVMVVTAERRDRRRYDDDSDDDDMPPRLAVRPPEPQNPGEPRHRRNNPGKRRGRYHLRIRLLAPEAPA